ncbi:MAG: NAD-binding protein [Solirubrobacterales bacterium]
MVRAIDDDVPMLLTIFNPTMAEQIAREVSNTTVTSLAEIVAPSLAGPCVNEDATAIDAEREPPVELIERDGELSEQPVTKLKSHRIESIARALFTPYDKSAGLLLYGAIGLVAIFLLETVTSIFVLDDTVIDAIYGSAKTLVTVDPNDKVATGPAWYKLFTSLTMLVALLFAAGFTAGLVNRVIDRRLTGLLGKRAVPRRDHVVVIGLGQVGLQLCLLLRQCGVPVVSVEHDEEDESVGLAREYGLPVVVGRGGDPSLLERLSLPKARAVAAVTADDLENISVAMTARGVEKDVRLVLRVGDGDVANETRSLLALGVIRDTNRMAATQLAALALGEEPQSVVCLGDEAHLRYADGRLEPAQLATLAGSDGE